MLRGRLSIWVGYLFAAFAAIGGITSACAEVDNAIFSPIILMRGSAIVGCGFRLNLPASDTEFDLKFEGDSQRPKLVLQARQTNKTAVFVSLVSDHHDSDSLFGPSKETPDGSVVREALVSDDRATEFLRDIFVSGGTAEISFADLSEKTVRIDGPMPMSTRVAYLSCVQDFGVAR